MTFKIHAVPDQYCGCRNRCAWQLHSFAQSLAESFAQCQTGLFCGQCHTRLIGCSAGLTRRCGGTLRLRIKERQARALPECAATR